MRIVAMWLVGALLWAAFVAFTAIGPVIVDIGAYHGVHATDLVVGAVIAVSLLRATRRRPSRGRRGSPATSVNSV